MLPVSKIRDLLKAERGRLGIELSYNLELLCDYAEKWDTEIWERAKSLMIVNFKLKGTKKKVVSVNYETKEIEIK